MPPNPLEPGRRIGRYQLVRSIGRGGAGEVWEALLEGAHGFRKEVAVKLLHAGPAEADHREALVREARLGGLLSHPNVVATLELGEEGGVWFVAMELVRGAPVSALVRSGPLSAPAVVDLGVQVCAALTHLHALRDGASGAGLVHRDVKPQNLLVDRSGLVKLADLGISRFAGVAGQISGTPSYMAPEQSVGREDTRADLFALGATLYALATGKRPFGSGAPAAIRSVRVEELLADPAFLAPADARLPGLGDVLRRCLRLDPALRFPLASDLAAALRALRVGSGPTLLELLGRARPELAPEAPSAWKPALGEPTVVLASGRSPLPTRSDRFVGRADDVARVAGRIEAGGLCTVVAIGGMGKTRLALEVARTLGGRFPGGAWFCELAEARTAGGVTAAVAKALGVPLVGEDPVATVGHALRSRGRALVVVDNFEQVVAFAAETVESWRAAAPEVAWLATSQRPLQLPGEVTVALEPLEPAVAAELFAARAVRPPSPEERPLVEELCARLDGMPLAIELAAARTRLVGVQGILDRLVDRFRLVAGGGADRPARHRSLRASLDGTWDLLGPHARRGLARLSVFAGGFALDAAEAVLASEPDAPWALDVLTELSESSLLAPDGDRFRMLVGIQEYAAEKLTAEERADAELRHGVHFALLASAGKGTVPPADLENLVAASQRATSRRDAGVAAATAVAACERLEEVGPYALGLTLLSGAAALDLSPTDTSVVLRSRSRLLGYLGRGPEALEAATAALASAGTDAVARLEAAIEVAERLRTAGRAEEARLTGEQALAAARERGNPAALASALLAVGSSWMQAGRYDDAHRAFDEGLSLFRACGDGLGEGAALSSQAALATEQGRHQQARDLAATAVTLHRRNGSRRREATSLANVGLAEAHLGRNEAARQALGKAQGMHADLGDRRGEAIVLSHLARVHIADGRTDDARRSLATSIGYSRDAHDAPRLCPTLIQLAVLEHIDGQFQKAQAVYGEALAVAESAGLARFEAQAAMNSGVLLVENGALEAGAALLRRAERAYERLGLNAGRALTLANLGAALVELGLPDEARRALEDAVTAGRGCSSAWASGNALLGLGEFLLNHGRGDAALPLVQEGVEVLTTLGRASASRGRALLARVHREAGELALAESTLAFSGDETTSQDTTVPAWLELARLRLAQGDAEEAVEAASHALDRAAAFLPLAAQASCVLALARDARGDRDGALAACEEAARLVDRAGSVGDTPLRRELARTRDALG